MSHPESFAVFKKLGFLKHSYCDFDKSECNGCKDKLGKEVKRLMKEINEEREKVKELFVASYTPNNQELQSL